MTHSNRNREQQKKNLILKGALSGLGEDVDRVVNVFGNDYVYHSMANPVATSSSTLVELYFTDIELKGGTYSLDMVTFFRLDGAGAPQQDFGVLEFHINDAQTGITYQKTRTENPTDEFEIATFNQGQFPPGTYKIALWGRIDTELDETLTVDRFRFRATRINEEFDVSQFEVGP